ncbi:MAG: hypothetical protein JJU11_02380 [Candidatus Sumerlaeia bacterium]|nr:hypothetical protein [Candidatus Sumerlaeia bacterium]
MNRWNYALTATLLLMGGNALADGMASASTPFEVTRGGIESVTTSSAVFTPGDVIVPHESMVQLEFIGGNAVMVDAGSQATVTGANSIELQKGALIAGKRGTEAMTVSFSDLSITPLGDAASAATVFVGQLPSGDIQVSVFDGNFSILSGSAMDAVASLGRGDVIQLRRVGDAWTTVTEFAAMAGGLGPIATGALGVDFEGGFFFWWTTPVGLLVGGLGLAGIAGATYFILDDDGGRRRTPTEREPFSPITSNDEE